MFVDRLQSTADECPLLYFTPDGRGSINRPQNGHQHPCSQNTEFQDHERSLSQRRNCALQAAGRLAHGERWQDYLRLITRGMLIVVVVVYSSRNRKNVMKRSRCTDVVCALAARCSRRADLDL